MSNIPITDEIKTQLPSRSITYSDIAAKLLNDRLLLTALELHTELIEAGKELKQLKDFFSNPGNFELQTQEIPSLISRSGSQATLDSLDLTRYSEDGERGNDERVAVLEFELRKAKETITALRNNLTVATESETTTPNKSSLKQLHTGIIKPHEQRALNFLINEYLLLHGYKLTSITFSDENENQDFEDWDDVGLNISKPVGLLALYREGLRQTGQNCLSVPCQTDFDNKLEKQNTYLAHEVEEMKMKITELESHICDIKNDNFILQKQNNILSSQNNRNNNQNSSVIVQETSNDSTGSNSPERFEIIEKNSFATKKCDSIITIDDNISNNSFNTCDWTNVTVKTNENSVDLSKSVTVTNKNTISIDDKFKKEIFSLCYVNISNQYENEILNEIVNQSVEIDNLIHTLSATLLQVIPNIILNKREEIIPLIVKAVHLNSNAAERDKLLQQLFNLKKKPSEVERSMILNGIVAIAKCSGESLVENEILPQCWEQLVHKYTERRLLVAESCNALIPYVSSSIRNSLILSMLQQMLEDKEELVRESVINGLSLVAVLCDDENKYSQCEELALNSLNDISINVINVSVQILFPVLAKWALEIERLRSDLIKHLLHKLNEGLKDTDGLNKGAQTTEKILRIVNVLEHLLPFVLISVVDNNFVTSNIEKDMTIELRSDLMKLCSNLTNPVKFYHKPEINVGMLLYEFNKLIDDNAEITWPELDWFVDIVIPDLLNNLNHIDITNHALLNSFIKLFSHICIIFGKSFAKLKIRPLLQAQLQCLEQIVSSFNQFSPSLNIIPVYLVSILSYCDDLEELSNVFTRFLFVLPLCGTPLDCLEITARGLCELNMHEILVNCLWQGVVHQRPLVRVAAATLFSSVLGSCSENLLSTKITPALVTLASDNDVLVRTATIPALGSLISDTEVQEVQDKAYMQIQTYIADGNLRDNHTLLRQLIVTLGSIAKSCKSSFKHEVILPQLSALSAYMSQMSNQTRKVDMALALVEAFSNVIYTPLDKDTVGLIILPGLKCLETVVNQNPSLMSYCDTVLSMIKECDNKIDTSEPSSSSVDRTTKIGQNVNQGVEEMKQKVSKIFNKPTNVKSSSLSNLQVIFKKK